MAEEPQLRHDHGSAYMSDHLRAAIEFLGISSSPAFVRAPEGRRATGAPNGSSGSLSRTCCGSGRSARWSSYGCRSKRAYCPRNRGLYTTLVRYPAHWFVSRLLGTVAGSYSIVLNPLVNLSLFL